MSKLENKQENSTGEKRRVTRKTQGPVKKMHLKNRVNGWKITTLLLLGFLLGGGFYLFSLVSTNREADYQNTKEKLETIGPEIEILSMETNKEKVNVLIDHYLEEYLSTERVKYEFYLENQALLKGTFELLGYPLNFYLYFEPYVMEDGDVQLKAKSVSIGSLGIPIKEVLRYIRSNFDFPKWIEVSLEDETIVLHLSQLNLATGLKIKANKINLVDNDIRFDLYLSQNKVTKKEKTNDTTKNSTQK